MSWDAEPKARSVTKLTAYGADCVQDYYDGYCGDYRDDEDD